MIEQIDAAALHQARANELSRAVLLDVREAWEFERARIDGSVNIPMSTLSARVGEVRDLQNDDDTPLVMICHHGSRSMHCAQFLATHGLTHLINLRGGIDAWSTQVDPAVPRY